MEFYLFVWGILAWTVLVACLVGLNIPMAALAFRVWHGTRSMDEEDRDTLWFRSLLVSFTIAGIAVLLVVVDHVLVEWGQFPAGPVHLVVYLGLIGLAAWMMMLFFGVEDFFQGLSLTVLYLYLPVVILFAVNWLVGLAAGPDWNPLLGFIHGWLTRPTG